MKRIAIYGLLVLLLVVPAMGYTENFQNGADGWVAGSLVATPYLDTYGLRLTYSASMQYGIPIPINYYAFSTLTQPTQNVNIRTYDSSFNLLDDLYSPVVPATPPNSRIIITRSDGHLYYSLNGSVTDLGVCSATQPYYVVLVPQVAHVLDIDDVVIGSGVTDVVGCPPHTWFVGNDIIDPSLKGLFDAAYNNVYTNYFHYTISNSTGTSIQSYNITNPPTSGTITITSGAASDYINCKSTTLSGGNTSWDKASYVTNDAGVITYTITSNYWDTTTYNYQLKVYKVNDDGTNTQKQATTISTMNGTGSYTFTDDGYYYAVTVLNYKSAPNTDYWLYPSALVSVQSGVQIFGYTYDGFINQRLPSVAVGAKQNGIWYNTTSDSSGYYNLSHIFSTGQQVDFVGTKANYTAATFNYTFINPQTCQVDLSLIPTLYVNPDPQPVIAHDGTAIGGYVKDDAGSFILGALVSISNGTYSNTYSITPVGTYLFDNLAAQSVYTVSATKSGYSPVTASVSTGESGTITYHNFKMFPLNGTINGTTVAGYTIDASKGIVISGASVNMSNLSWSSLTTTGATGFFQYGQLATGSAYNLSGSKTGYTPTSTSLTTGAANTIQYYDLYLNPDSFGVTGGAGLGGFIFDSSTLGGLSNASVNIHNNTFSISLTSSSPYGAYVVENLSANSQYTITASKTNYTSASKTATTGLDGTMVYTNIYIAPDPNAAAPTGEATIVGQVTDSTTLAAITGVTMSITGGSANTTTTAPYGVYYFDSLTPNTNYTVTATMVNYTTQSIIKQTGKDGSSETLNFRLAPTGSSTASGQATLVGQVIDASTLGGLVGATVNVSNNSWSTTTTTIAPHGLWNVPDLNINSTYRVSASKTNYTPASASATTEGQGSSVWTTLYLYPTTSNATPILNGTSIYGLVLSTPFNEAVPGATVTCTGQNGTTTDAGGFYKFENLQASTSYTVGASKVGYSSTSAPVTTGVANTGTQQILYLAAGYTVTVNCIDTVTNAAITNATVTVNGADPKGAPATYSLAYGSYTFAASASGYYSGAAADTYVSNDKTVTIYMTPTNEASTFKYENQGPGQAYPPHHVRFTIQTVWGKVIPNATVTCIGYETTAGTFTWLYECFGFNTTSTRIANSTLNGTTDHLGDINFMMFEAVKYNVTVNASGYTNKTFDFYPKDEYYIIAMEDMSNTSWYQGGYNIQEKIISNVTADELTGNITVRYVDYLNSTYSWSVWVNQTDKGNVTLPERMVVNITNSTSNCTNISNYNYTFPMTAYAGKSYVVHIKANSTVFTQQILRDYGVTFRPAQINPMGLSDFELMLISMFFLIFMATMFGAINAPQGGILVCFVGWILWMIGWMRALGDTAPIVLTLATVMSVAVLIYVRSRKVNYL